MNDHRYDFEVPLKDDNERLRAENKDLRLMFYFLCAAVGVCLAIILF